MKNKENGRSMVEMLGVLAIIGVLSAAALAGYSKAMFRHKMNQTIDEATKIFQRFEEIKDKDWGAEEVDIYGSQKYLEYGLLEKCKNSNGESCELPIGRFWADIYQNTETYGAFYFIFTDSKSCIAFLSAHWEESLPVEWWNPQGEITVGCSNHTLYKPMDGINEISMQDIIQSCQCFDDDHSGSSIQFVYRYQ